MTGPDQTLSSSAAPLVSVAITAFNRAHCLPRALDSAIEQQTSFPIEIVIGEDGSTDSTLDVAKAYEERYPGIVRVLLRDKNLGMQRNYYETFEECRGKFIAWLDSDDVWTDPQKLALQVQTMESDESITICGHVVRWVDQDGVVNRERYPSIPAGRYGIEEIIRHNIVPSPSIMFRNGLQRRLPASYFDLKCMADWPLLALASLSGDIVLLDRVMADYMLSANSSFMSKGVLYWHEMDIEFYDHIESVLPSRWQRLARAEKGKRYESMAYLLRQQGDFVASREAAFKAFCSPSLMDNSGSKTKSLLAAVIREIQWRLRGKPTAEPN